MVLTVGAVAARLGVAPETVRSWERRYGLAPGGRSPGGHRRYTEVDCARLVLMQRLVSEGAMPAKAAATVLSTPAEEVASRLPALGRAPAREAVAGEAVAGGAAAGAAGVGAGSGQAGQRRTGGAGGRTLAMPGASAEARGLARAASRLDADAVMDLLGNLLVERGAVATWDEVLRPVLVAVGARWERTGEGVDVEHLLSEATTDALRAHRARQLRPVPGRCVLLACAPEDEHVLPLHVAAVALAERRVPVRLLGPRVPPSALASATRRLRASGVLVWKQRAEGPPADLEGLPQMRPRLVLAVGGPGWSPDDVPTGARLVGSLGSAVAVLQVAPR
jgi:MerR family transcriptional regulator, light-induced transcriptional regulator